MKINIPHSAKLAPLILSAGILGFSPSATAVTLLNGSFESENFSTPDYFRYVPSFVMTGWTATYNGPGEGSYLMDTTPGGYTAYAPFANGTHVMRLAYGESISQTATGLTVGLTYTVTFDLIQLDSGDPASFLTLSGGGVSTDFSTGFTSPSISFVASGTTAVISLAAVSTVLDGNFLGVSLDNIRIVEIPEPSTSIIAVLGALICTSRRRR